MSGRIWPVPTTAATEAARIPDSLTDLSAVTPSFVRDSASWSYCAPRGTWDRWRTGFQIGQYAVDFTPQTAVLVPAVTHGRGPSPYLAQCKDAAGDVFEPGATAVNPSGDVTLTFQTAASGRCYIR